MEYPGVVFDTEFEDAWFDNPLVEKMIKDIDNSEHITGSVFVSQYGAFPPQKLSGGVKTLIMMLYNPFPEYVYPLSWLGENCYKYLNDVSTDHDIYLDADTVPYPGDLGCTIISTPDGREIKTARDLAEEFAKYVKLS